MINKQLCEMFNVTNDDYRQWCKDNKKAMYKTSSKKEFFERLSDGRLVKDKRSNQLVKQRKKSK